MKTLSPDMNASALQGSIVRKTWNFATPPPHEFVAVVCEEAEGGYSVFALNYPGVISQGDTMSEVESNIAEAFAAMLEARRKHGEDMQFSHSPWLDVPASSQRLWIKFDG